MLDSKQSLAQSSSLLFPLPPDTGREKNGINCLIYFPHPLSFPTLISGPLGYSSFSTLYTSLKPTNFKKKFLLLFFLSYLVYNLYFLADNGM